MEKLTKSQAEWLIEQIQNSDTKGRGLIGLDIAWNIHAIKSILRQCTEKEFPVFEVTVGCDPGN